MKCSTDLCAGRLVVTGRARARRPFMLTASLCKRVCSSQPSALGDDALAALRMRQHWRIRTSFRADLTLTQAYHKVLPSASTPRSRARRARRRGAAYPLYFWAALLLAPAARGLNRRVLARLGYPVPPRHKQPQWRRNALGWGWFATMVRLCSQQKVYGTTSVRRCSQPRFASFTNTHVHLHCVRVVRCSLFVRVYRRARCGGSVG